MRYRTKTKPARRRHWRLPSRRLRSLPTPSCRARWCWGVPLPLAWGCWLTPGRALYQSKRVRKAWSGETQGGAARNPSTNLIMWAPSLPFQVNLSVFPSHSTIHPDIHRIRLPSHKFPKPRRRRRTDPHDVSACPCYRLQHGGRGACARMTDSFAFILPPPSFYDLVIGIEDPNEFIPPPFCDKAELQQTENKKVKDFLRFFIWEQSKNVLLLWKIKALNNYFTTISVPLILKILEIIQTRNKH